MPTPNPAPDPPEGFLPRTGNYEDLLCFQKAEVVYDFTFHFCHKYLAHDKRTTDQMVQAARSGSKNLVEGSKAAKTSSETEMKLTNVARASLEEVLRYYRDFLRTRKHPIWEKDSRQALYVRKLGKRKPQTYELYREFLETRPPDVAANIALCLIHQANYLIDQLLRRQEREFLKNGGIRERMTQARLRARNTPTPQTPPPPRPKKPPP